MRLSLTTLFLTAGFLVAQEATSDPIGFNKVTCLANSDTIVGVPLRKEGSLQTTLSGAPTGTGDSITLPVTATLTAGQYNATSLTPTFLPKYYVKFTGEGKTNNGYWYSVESNTATSITINLNGDTLTGVASADPILVARYWSLNELFKPDVATTSAATTPHAIVRSSSALARATELLLPNYEGQGINLSSSGTYYITGITGGASVGIWKKIGSSSNTEGETIVYPDSYFIIRHNSSVTANTVFRSLGEVETGKLSIPLSTRSSGKQDNYIAIPRPIPVSLADLNLDTISFRTSPNALSRLDELLVFDLPDTGITGKNRSASATYFRVLNNGVPEWRKINGGATNHNSTTIPAGAGFIIRKATSDGNTVFWNNTPNWTNN